MAKPEKVAASPRPRFVYKSVVGLGVALAIGLGVASFALSTSSTDPADSGIAVSYRQLPLPDEDEFPPLTKEQQQLLPYYVELPRSVTRGDDIRYTIELRNPTDRDISLDPCPAYFSSFGESSTAWFDSGYLNCAEAPPVVRANGSVRFEMVLHLTPDLDGMKSFVGSVHWRLEGPNGSSEAARVDSILGSTMVAVSTGGCLETTDSGKVRDRCKARPSPESCPPGIEGEGLEMVKQYPPRPNFEAFNLWRAKSNQQRDGCVVILAGQQVASDSEDGTSETVYEPNGYLLILNDYKKDKDGIAKVEVQLPRPIRIFHASGRGYRSGLILQSLEDCSAILFNVPSRSFHPDPGDAASGPCPAA